MKEYVGIRQATKGGYIKCEVGGVADFLYPTSTKRRGRVQGDGQICPTITSENTGVCKVEQNEMYIEDGVLKTNKNILNGKDAPETDWANCEYRIRKLTPTECMRLMGVQENDIEKMKKVNSNTQIYKQAGNSIVVSVLMAVFSQLNIRGITSWNEMPADGKYDLISKGCFKSGS